MVPLNVSVTHCLGQPAAIDRVQQLLDRLQREYAGQISDVRGQWDDNQLKFGFSVSGLPIDCKLTVQESDVSVSSDLPLAAALFRGKIESWIRDELRGLLS
jgi:hypothetical protein